MAGRKGQKKRLWSDEEKVSICGPTRAPGVSVAQVARRYAMNTNLIHKWLRDPRFVPDDTADDGGNVEAATFLPIEVEGVASSSAMVDLPMHAPTVGTPLSAHRADITLSDGWRILVEGATALSAVLALVEGLMT